MSALVTPVSGGQWIRDEKNIPANTEITVDQFNVANMFGRTYIITAFNKIENKSKTLCLAVAKANGLPVDTIYGKIGSGIILDVTVTDGGLVKVNNRNAFALKLVIDYITQGE